VGERWADLAVAAWSTEWNFGLGWDNLVYESYGLEPDRDKIQFFRLLWDLA
jgi:kanamycin kinase